MQHKQTGKCRPNKQSVRKTMNNERLKKIIVRLTQLKKLMA